MENKKKLYKLFKDKKYSEMEAFVDREEGVDIELKLRVKAFLSYLADGPLSGEKALPYYFELSLIDSKYYLDIALIYMNRKEIKKSIFFLEKVTGDDRELARFYLAFVFSYKGFGIQDSSSALKILRHDLNVKHLCSSQLYCKIMMHFEPNLFKRVLLNLKKIAVAYKCLFISFVNPVDVRLSSRGGFEIFDVKMQGLLDDLYSDENFFNVNSRIFFEKIKERKQ